jgi:cholesterol transport system auxiliary component
MKRADTPSRRLPLVTAAALLVVASCGILKPYVSPSGQPTSYSLAGDSVAKPAQSSPGTTALTLIVNHPHAAAGFDSLHMIYLRHPDELEHFAHNEWIDTPARMLPPLIVSAVANRGVFRAVVQTASPATGDLRLDTEILRLQQEFFSAPSRVRFTLRAYLVDIATRRVVAAREFEAVAAAPSDDPRGGVTAAQMAVKNVLADLADFCAQTAASMKK